jgi:Phage tail tube protein
MTVISSDIFQLGIVKLTGGPPPTIPGSPAFILARLSSESLNFQPTTIVSPELDPSGQVRDSILTGARSTGNIELPLSRHPFFEESLAAVLRSAWGSGLKGDGTGPPPATSAVGANEMIVGNALSLYAVEKRFTNPAGGFIYHRFHDSALSSMSINVSPGKEVSVSVAVSGGSMEPVETALAGVTYPDPGVRPLFTAPEVSEVTVAGLTNALCFNDLSIELNSNVRGVECIGTLGFKEQVLGRFEATIRGSAYFTSNDLLDYLINQQSFASTIVLDDPEGNKYEFFFPRCRMTTGGANASGTNQDVVSAVTMQALYDPTRLYTVMVTRTHVA